MRSLHSGILASRQPADEWQCFTVKRRELDSIGEASAKPLKLVTDLQCHFPSGQVKKCLTKNLYEIISLVGIYKQLGKK